MANAKLIKYDDTDVVVEYARKDGSGNDIATTYATQTQLENKQDTLSTTQLAAANSGVTSDKVNTYDNYATTKQDTLTAGTGVTIENNVISTNLNWVEIE